MAGGVLAGANSPIQIDLKPWNTKLGHGRHVGRLRVSFRGEDADALDLARFDVGQRRWRGIEEEIDAARKNIRIGQGRPAVRNVQQVRSRDLHEGRGDDVLPSPDADIRDRQLAPIFFAAATMSFGEACGKVLLPIRV